jgi:type VI secretion system secreted protein Hcp
MAFDAFLKIDGIPGESTDDKHKDWIEILSYNQGMTQPSSATASSAGGGTTERVTMQDFSVVKHLDKASPKLYELCCTGKHIANVTLELCRAGGDKVKYMEVKMEQVIISGVQPGGAAGAPTSFPRSRLASISARSSGHTHSRSAPTAAAAAMSLAAGTLRLTRLIHRRPCCELRWYSWSR